MPWSGGVYTRGYPSWSNDAASNLPISATKFDLEDNDFATGLNNCLTKDGLNVPTATLQWSQTASAVANFSRASDGTVFQLSRTGGSNNPSLSFVDADTSGFSLNVAGGGLSLALAGVAYLALAVGGALSINAPSGNSAQTVATSAYTFGNATDNPTFTFQGTGAVSFGGAVGFTGAITGASISVNGSSVPANGIYLPSANTLGFASNTVQRATVDASGRWVFAAPTTTGQSAFSFTGIAGNNVMAITAGSTAGTAFGLAIKAGTNTSDYAVDVQNQGGTTDLFRVLGNGEVYIQTPPAATAPPTGMFQAGYIDAPITQISASQSASITWRGKMVEITGGSGQTLTLPALVSGMMFMIINLGGSTWSIASTTLTWLPSTTTGTRTLAVGGIATVFELGGTANWYIWGAGIS